MALPEESHECGAAGCYVEVEIADQFERRREAKPLDHVGSFSCWCQYLVISSLRAPWTGYPNYNVVCLSCL